jgi:hypothetical protein
MNTRKTGKGHGGYVTGGVHRHGVVPPDSELPPVEPEVSALDVVPHPAADAGGVDNLPEELLSDTERLADQLDHARLDVELPGEDQARLGDATGE